MLITDFYFTSRIYRSSTILTILIHTMRVDPYGLINFVEANG